MGCGSSQAAKIPYGKTNSGANGIQMGSTERRILGEAISPTGAERVRIQEEAKARTPPREMGSFKLPEGEFVDGLLGTTDDQTMRGMTENLPQGSYFVDPDFPPSEQSLFFDPDAQEEKKIEWKRPRDVSSAPRLYVGGTTRMDVVQGKLGDCWFLSSCAAVAKNQRFIERIVPSGQPLDGPEYRGFIVCRFWRFGDWVSVCIDDFLPTVDGKLIYAKSEDSDEFWIALLEKAYAKLHGCYQALEGGQSMDALVDLTGGIAERFDLEDSPDRKRLFKYISMATRNGAFVTTSRKGDWKNAFKADKNGLVEGHAYTVSGVAKVNHKTRGIVPLVRMRNPWANSAEWMGKWSDGDEMWDAVSPKMRKKLLRENKMDGEFWMSFDDFFREFEEVSLCTTGPDFDGDGVVDQVGTVLAIRGQWVPGKSAGGSRNDFPKFATNPQFLLTLREPEEEEDEDLFLDVTEMEASRGKCHVLIGLMQEHRFSVRGEGVHMHQIAFSVYKSHNPGERIPLRQFYRTYDEGTSGVYINYREVIARLELNPGHYVIIPATFEPDIPGNFIIRVYSPHRFDLKSLE